MKVQIQLKLALLITIVFSSCAGAGENTSDWQGEWNATWETNPASFEALGNTVDYSMSGKITFDEDSVNIRAFGYDKCVFSKDTLDHTLRWKISHDSLILVNDERTPGMVYLIKEKTNDKIKLQLMDDIFLTLLK